MKKDNYKKSRRDFVKNLGLTTLGISSLSALSSTLIACKQESDNTKHFDKNSEVSSLAVRKNIASIPANDPEIKLFKDAISILKKRSFKSPLDPSGWQAHSMLHTTFCATSIYANQMHYNWYVWPWHRLYLWSLEQKIQKAVNEPSLALHYWDWTKDNSIPQHYWGDNSNPLFNKTRQVGPNDKIPTDFMNVGAAFRASNYKVFGGHPAIKKRGEQQLDGLAEQTFHNNIHNWIGGQMATFSESGFDPIFYGHHGNCDRVWEAWRNYNDVNHFPTDEEWLEKRLFATDGNGTPVDFKIKDLLDTEKLGYRFENLDFNKAFTNPYFEYHKPNREGTKGEKSGKLQVSNSVSDAIYKQLRHEVRTNVMLHFSRVQIPYHAYNARVFFEYEVNSNIVSRYADTFTILPILDLDSLLLQQGVHLQIEISQELADVIKQGKEVQVVLQPVPLPNRNIPDESIKLQDISLKLID